jgi:hypothetical protein
MGVALGPVVVVDVGVFGVETLAGLVNRAAGSRFREPFALADVS